MSKNKLIIILLSVTVIIFSAGVGIFSAKSTKLKTDAIIYPEIIEIKAESEGTLKDIYVQPKQSVEQGQLIAEIEVSKKNDTQSKTVVKPDVSGAKSKLDKAEEKYKNSALMYKDGVITQEDYDKSLDDLTSAQTAYKNAVQKANAVTAEQNKMKNAVEIKKVYAPRDGVVNANFINKGEEAKQNNPILLLDVNNPKVTAYVDEKTAAKLKNNQEVKILVKNKNRRSFPGVIELISSNPSRIDNSKEPVYAVFIGFKENVSSYQFKKSQPVSVIFK